MQLSKSLALLAALAAACAAQDFFDEGPGYDDYYGDYGAYGDMGDLGGYGDFGGYGDYGDYGDYGGYGAEARQLLTLQELQEFVAEEAHAEPAVVGLFDAAEHAEDLRLLRDFAAEAGFPVAYSTAPQLLEDLGYDGCAVLVYKPAKYVSDKYEKAKARFPGKTLKYESLKTFVNSKILPLVGPRTFAWQARYEATGLPVVTLFTQTDLDTNEKVFNYFANRMRKVAQNFQNKVLFNIGNAEHFTATLKEAGLEVRKNEAGVLLEDKEMYYNMDEPFSVDNLQKFVEDYLAHRLTGVKKPERQPLFDEEEEEDEALFEESGVVTLTDENFDEVVMQSNKDVMVEFYAPWCGHCKRLKPEYAEAAKQLAVVDTVTVAAMDATKYTVPEGFDVQGYPTLYFVPAKDKKHPILYEGGRDSFSLVAYIQSHSSFSDNAHGEL